MKLEKEVLRPGARILEDEEEAAVGLVKANRVGEWKSGSKYKRRQEPQKYQQ